MRNADNQAKLIIFVKDYLEFVKMRKFLKSSNSPFQSISEYSDKRVVQRTLAMFNQGKIQYLLVSERAEFFRV